MICNYGYLKNKYYIDLQCHLYRKNERALSFS